MERSPEDDAHGETASGEAASGGVLPEDTRRAPNRKRASVGLGGPVWQAHRRVGLDAEGTLYRSAGDSSDAARLP